MNARKSGNERTKIFRAFMSRLSCVHVQTIVRSPDHRAFMSRPSCVHVQTIVRSSVFPDRVILNARHPLRAFILVWTYLVSVWHLILGYVAKVRKSSFQHNLIIVETISRTLSPFFTLEIPFSIMEFNYAETEKKIILVLERVTSCLHFYNFKHVISTQIFSAQFLLENIETKLTDF